MSDSSPLRPDIVGVRPTINGVVLTLRCRRCEVGFDSFQPEVAGVHLGSHSCPGCGGVVDVLPEDLAPALERLLPTLTYDEMGELTEEASRISVTWYTHPLVEAALTHGDQPLGPATELYLQPHVTAGLLIDLARRGR
jgi:hypothetical protein